MSSTVHLLIGVVASFLLGWLVIWNVSPSTSDVKAARARQHDRRMRDAVLYVCEGRADVAILLYGRGVFDQALDHLKDRYAAEELSLDQYSRCVGRVVEAADRYGSDS